MKVFLSLYCPLFQRVTSEAEEAAAGERGVQGLRKKHGGLRLPRAIVCEWGVGGVG